MADGLGVRVRRFQVPRFALLAVAKVLDGVSRFSRRSFPLNSDKLNEILPEYWICSSEKAKRDLGFSPRVSLKSGVFETMRWYREAGWID
jgi:nucleoside-diphosphate-sugar epimerase